MNKIPRLIKAIVAVNILFGLLAVGGIVRGQTTNQSALDKIWQGFLASDIMHATNYSIEPYVTYAPNAPQHQQIGGGALAVYNVNNYVGVGFGLDYLGQFSLVSADVTLKVPTHPLTFLGGGWTNVAVVPFALAGVGTPLSGSPASAAVITDVGGYVGFGHLWGGQFNTGVAYGRWDNAGAFTGPRYHIFAGWSKGF